MFLLDVIKLISFSPDGVRVSFLSFIHFLSLIFSLFLFSNLNIQFGNKPTSRQSELLGFPADGSEFPVRQQQQLLIKGLQPERNRITFYFHLRRI